MENTFASFKPITLNPNPSKEEIQQEYFNSNNDYLDKDISSILGISLSPATSATPAPQEIKSEKKYNIRELLDENPPETLTASVKSKNTSIKPKNKKEFLQIYSPMAEEASKKLNIPKDYLLAQIALETG